MLAIKAALGVRVDALASWGMEGEEGATQPSEEQKSSIGRTGHAAMERRLRSLEGKPLRSVAVQSGPPGHFQTGRWNVEEARKYNPNADGVTSNEPINTTTLEALTGETVTHAKEDEALGPELNKDQRKAARVARKAELAAKRAAKLAKQKTKVEKKRKLGVGMDLDEADEKKKRTQTRP
jgi:nucleolar protein 58